MWSLIIVLCSTHVCVLAWVGYHLWSTLFAPTPATTQAATSP